MGYVFQFVFASLFGFVFLWFFWGEVFLFVWVFIGVVCCCFLGFVWGDAITDLQVFRSRSIDYK